MIFSWILFGEKTKNRKERKTKVSYATPMHWQHFLQSLKIASTINKYTYQHSLRPLHSPFSRQWCISIKHKSTKHFISAFLLFDCNDNDNNNKRQIYSDAITTIIIYHCGKCKCKWIHKNGLSKQIMIKYKCTSCGIRGDRGSANAQPQT